MAVRWQFIEDLERHATYWVWRTVRVDETIEDQSPRMTSYGAAVCDAIRHGFRPREEHWIVVTARTVTHFQPGGRAVSLSIADEEAVSHAGWQRLLKKQRSAPLPGRIERRKKVRQ